MHTIFSAVIAWFSSQLNLTTAIAVTSLALSLFTALKSALSGRRNLKIRIQARNIYQTNMILVLAFANCSTLPVAVTNVEVRVGKAFVSCAPIPTLIAKSERREGGKCVATQEWLSDALPIPVPALGAVSSRLYFVHLPASPEKNATHLTVRVSTNRGRAFQRKLKLPEEASPLQILY